MGKSLSIGKKIGLSISILILGYFATMVIGFVLGRNTETRLLNVSESIFPASVYSQTALSAFREEIKLYNDAVLLGDEEVLETAKKKSAEINSAFQSIEGLVGIGDEKLRQVKEIRISYNAFHGRAQSVYQRMSRGDNSSGVMQEAMELGKQTPLTEKDLDGLKADFAQNLKTALHDISDSTKRQRYTNLFVFLGVVLGATLLISVIIYRSVSKPLKDTVFMIKDLAEGEGDLTRRLKVISRDEVGELAQWLNLFLEKLQTIIQQLASNSGLVDTAASELLTISGQMSAHAEDTSSLANTVASATEQMNISLSDVASAVDQSSNNANMVASASEEMTTTINEIAQKSDQARNISDQAVHQAKTAGEKMAELGLAAKDIGKITEAITEISEQTNLLSLNATIEAARAGEAGKGFAVVANEIKELAKQTAVATQDIRSKISGIQTTTLSTVTEINEITSVINQVNEIVASIAMAVDEQSHATREIAEKISQTSTGIQQVNVNTGHSSKASAQIAEDISRVKVSAGDISDNSAQVNTRAKNLKEMAGQLNAVVGRFRV